MSTQDELTSKRIASLQTYYEQLIELQRHEDILLNTRLQLLVVSTAFLIAAYAQFRNLDYRTALLLRIIICVFGISLASIFHHLLGRTAKAIWWYIREICDTERDLYPPEYQPYIKRRLQRDDSKWRASGLLGQWIPCGIIILWSLLFGAAFVHWWSFTLAVATMWLFSKILLKILGIQQPKLQSTVASKSSKQTVQTPAP